MHIRKLVFVIFLTVFILQSAFSQKNGGTEASGGLKSQNYIILPWPSKKVLPAFEISSIDVFDMRFDTVSLGFAKHLENSNRGELRIKNGLAFAAKKIFLGVIDSSSRKNDTARLVCFIKKLVLSDQIFVEGSEEATGTSKKFDKTDLAGVSALIEVYANQQNNYYPLYRFDTTITGFKNISTEGAFYISDALASCMQKLSSLDWQKIKTKGKVLDIETINARYNSRLLVPALSETPVKGVYFSFEQFLENKPAVSEFSYEKSAKGDFLYIKNKKGEDSLCIDMWGYCDGKDRYVYSASNFFKLERQGNSFSFYGAKEYSASRNLRLNVGLLDLISPNSGYSKTKTYNDYKLVKSYIQVDMDTGEFY